MYKQYPFAMPSRPDGPFRKGLFKYIVLQYLKDSPRHGYEIIRSLAHRFHGLYIPSPGTVYPRLQMLVEQGLVTFVLEEDRKVYTITEEGLKFLSEHKDLEKEINERLSDWENPENLEEIRRTMREYSRLGEMLSWELRKLDASKLKLVKETIVRTLGEVDAIIRE